MILERKVRLQMQKKKAPEQVEGMGDPVFPDFPSLLWLAALSSQETV